MGVDTLTLIDLFRKAAAHKGLRLCEGASQAYSEPIKVYKLDDKLLAALAKRGIRGQDRPDCHHQIFTLVDTNPQKKVPGWTPSNYWNFNLLEGDERRFDLRVSLGFGFTINLKKRGIIFWPQAHGSYVSAADPLPNFRMFKALVENDKDAPAIAKELAASKGNIMVTWTELGLGGIRKLSDLFAKFAGENKTIAQLGGNREIFNPVPHPLGQQPGGQLFVAKPAWPKVIQIWRVQLEKYRAHLAA